MIDKFLTSSQGNSVKAVFFDYQVKVVPAPDDYPQRREEIIAGVFDQTFLIQAQRLAPHLYAVIGASQDLVRNIYAALLPAKLEALVPYGMAVRAFLAGQNVDFGKLLAFVDDVQSEVLVTVIDGLNYTAPRSIDRDHLSIEIKRTIQNYCADNPQAQQKDIQILSAKDFFAENISLEGLKLARFPINFRPASEVLKEKHRKTAGFYAKNGGMILSALLLTTGLYAGACASAQGQDKILRDLQNQRSALLAQLQNYNHAHVGTLLRSENHLHYVFYYSQFLKALPMGYAIKHLSFIKQSNSQWSMQGVIVPIDKATRGRPFQKKGIFKHAKVTLVEVDKKLGQNIRMTIQEDNYV